MKIKNGSPTKLSDNGVISFVKFFLFFTLRIRQFCYFDFVKFLN